MAEINLDFVDQDFIDYFEDYFSTALGNWSDDWKENSPWMRLFRNGRQWLG